MASLTPLSKGLIGLVVIGGMASAVWHLYLKERMAADQPALTAPANTSATPAAVEATPAAPPSPPAAAAPANPPVAADAPSPGGTTAEQNFESGRKFVASGEFDQARPRLELALQQGHAGAACLLGEMTLKGQGGLTADRDKAAQLFQLAQSRNTICFTAGQ